MKSRVEPCWRSSPLTRVSTVRPASRSTSSADDGPNGAERVKALGAGPLAVFLLQVAGGDVVGQGEAANVGAPVGFAEQVAGAAADDQRQFAFEVDAGRSWRACGRCRRGASSDEGGLKKSSGSVGSSLPSSLAWSR